MALVVLSVCTTECTRVCASLCKCRMYGGVVNDRVGVSCLRNRVSSFFYKWTNIVAGWPSSADSRPVTERSKAVFISSHLTLHLPLVHSL